MGTNQDDVADMIAKKDIIAMFSPISHLQLFNWKWLIDFLWNCDFANCNHSSSQWLKFNYFCCVPFTSPLVSCALETITSLIISFHFRLPRKISVGSSRAPRRVVNVAVALLKKKGQRPKVGQKVVLRVELLPVEFNRVSLLLSLPRCTLYNWRTTSTNEFLCN